MARLTNEESTIQYSEGGYQVVAQSAGRKVVMMFMVEGDLGIYKTPLDALRAIEPTPRSVDEESFDLPEDAA